MKCLRCQHENPAGQKFCGECGAPLELAAAARFTSPESYTPGHLAEQILTARGALEGERKQVTVLFADLKGSMELLADRDPEDARKILDPVLEIMMEAVHRFEGTVNQVMGDGIMALFGAPLAHEDHALRACYAALRMQDAMRRNAEEARRAHGVTVEIRVGLNSGDVVVRAIGSDLRVDYSAIGQTTHLAARMEQLASPGRILLTAGTLELVEGYVEAKSLGPVPVKGLSGPVEIYELIGLGPLRTRFQVTARRGLTRFIGREPDTERLRQALARAGQGQGQVVAIVGEPGVGKSRLVFEFARSGESKGWLILQSSLISYGQATPYQPVIEILKALFQIETPEDPRQVQEKVTARLLALELPLESIRSALLTLLDAPVTDTHWRALEQVQRRQRTLDAVTALLVRESQRRPLLLVLEDVHWIDSETQALLDRLVESLSQSRILLVVTYRPGYQHRWTTGSVPLRLDPLSTAEAHELLDSLLGTDTGLVPLKRRLIDQTSGNPFFLEESVRTLVETEMLVGARGAYRLGKPLASIRIPATVQAVLAARIDRLPPGDKSLLQTAAVIGEDIPFALLHAVAGQAEETVQRGLAHLEAAELLRKARLFPVLEYAFKHGLTHQVAYRSLLAERRRALHARILDALERLYPEDTEALAHHAFLGEVWDRALKYLRQSGARAFAHSANREAAASFEQALTALEHLPDNPARRTEAIDLRFELRNALTLLAEHERTLTHLREAERLAESISDRRRQARAASFATNCLYLLGEHDQAVATGNRALEMALGLTDFPLKIATSMYLGRACHALGQYPHAIEVFREVVNSLAGERAHEHLGLPVLPAVFARSHLARCLSEVGELAEATALAEEGDRLAEAMRHPHTQLWAAWGMGLVRLAQGEPEAAARLFERALALCRTADMPTYVPRISSALGLVCAMCGRQGDALPQLESAVEQAQTLRQAATLPEIVLELAESYLIADRLDDAARTVERARALCAAQGQRGNEACALRLLADVALRRSPPGLAEADALYARALESSIALGMRPLAARCRLGRGLLHAARGETAKARDELNQAIGIFESLRIRFWQDRARASLAALG